jgi:hypothetical protein
VVTVVVSPSNVVNFPEGGGHFWVYMQYVQGLHQLGCEVYWLERVRPSADAGGNASTLAAFFRRMDRYGLSGKVILIEDEAAPSGADAPGAYIGLTRAAAEAVFRRADLLLNFHYATDPVLLSRFRRTALVDIDPGLLQFWLAAGQLRVPRHDLYFTTGETVGTPAALFPDPGLPWVHIRPPVCLECWPYTYSGECEAFTTVSSWWGDEWISTGQEVYENNKRVSFLDFSELPRLTSQVLELALFLGDGDAADRRTLEARGWRVRHAPEVSRTPEMYRSYIQGSRGEFSCAKPSCMKFQNAWVSDRTLCYLASGKPVVVQHTGPSAFLPNGEGMFRFSSLGEAVDSLARINADYERQCRAARAIAEAHFDAKRILQQILHAALA